MNSKARITYRFDKETGSARMVHKPTEEKEKERESKPKVLPFFQEELTFTTDIGAWNSPFQNDAQALEELIRDTDRMDEEEIGRAPVRNDPAEPPRDSAVVSNCNADYGSGWNMDWKPEEIKGPEPDADHRHARPVKFAPAQNAAPAGNVRRMRENADYGYQRAGYESVDERIPLGDERDMPSYSEESRHYPIVELEEDSRGGEARRGAGKLGSFQNAVSYRPGRNPSWFKVFASVVGAIATGAIFGYFALALFAGGDKGAPAVDGTDASPPSAAAGSQSANSGNAGGKSANAKENSAAASASGSAAADDGSGTADTIKVNIPADSYAMLQFGVFSNEDGLNAAVADLRNKGLAAATLKGEQDYRVYVGMASSREETQTLGQKLAGMDVYVKDIDISALSAVHFQGDGGALEAFAKQTGTLIRLMDDSSVRLLEDGQGGAIDAGWSEQHQKWMESATALETGIADKDTKAALLQMVQKVNAAAVAAQEYAKKSSDAHLWAMQTSLMEAVFAEKAWFASMDAL